MRSVCAAERPARPACAAMRGEDLDTRFDMGASGQGEPHSENGWGIFSRAREDATVGRKRSGKI